MSLERGMHLWKVAIQQSFFAPTSNAFSNITSRKYLQSQQNIPARTKCLTLSRKEIRKKTLWFGRHLYKRRKEEVNKVFNSLSRGQ
jgi:hypothetical protein